MRFIEKLCVIDNITTGSPSPAVAARIPRDELGQDTLDWYLLSRLKGDQWFETAQAVISGKKGNREHMMDGYFSFLLSCSPSKTVEGALAVGEIGSPHCLSLLQLASHVGFPHAAPLLEMFAEAKELPSKDFLAPAVTEVLKLAFASNEESVSCAVLRRFLRVEPDPKEFQPPTPQEGLFRFGLDPSIGIDPYSLQEFLSSLVPLVPVGFAPTMMGVLIDALSKAIELSIWPGERASKGSSDGSLFWRPAIEENENNNDFGYRERLVVSIRDLAHRIVESTNSLDLVEARLLSQRWLIFKRIRIHLLRTFPKAAGLARIRECLFDNEVRNGTDGWHEWALLLREQFRHLSAADQDAILDWIATEPEADEGRSQDHQADEEPGLSPRHLSRVRGKLAIIKDSIPEDWRAAHPKFCDGLDEVEPTEFHYRSLGGRWIAGDDSHLKVDEIVSMPPADLVAELTDWKEKDPYDGPSESGLRIALRAAAQQEPAEMLARLHQYDGLRPTRHVALLEGLWEAANAGASVDWRLLLEATEKEIQDRVLPHDRARDIQREASLGTALIRAIETALSKDHLPRECRRKVFQCIEAFLTHPDPAPVTEENETLPERLSSTSLNTPRPIALRCVFDYGRWLRRAEIEDAPEVLRALEEALRNEAALAVRSVFGEQMNWLLAIHRPWVEARLGELFPADAPAKRDAIWNCFVTMCGASKAALDVFRAEYGRAVGECRSEPREKPSSDWSPPRGFVRHLCAYYWWGFEPIAEGSLVAKFFETATLGLREYVFRYIAQALNETKDELPDAVVLRFMNLAEWRIEALQAKDVESPERQELQGFVRWVDAEKLPVEWSLQKLLDALKLVSGSLNEHQMLPLDFLAKHAEQYPALTIACMHELTFAPSRKGKTTPPWWGQEDEAKKVLRVALATKDKDTVRQAEEIQDHLLRLGRLQYRNLEPENDQDSDH